MKENNGTGFGKDYWQQDGGDKWVAHIDAVEQYLEPLNQMLITEAAPVAGENVLDVGCGGGLTSIAMLQAMQNSGTVIGVDVSPQILAVARERGKAHENLVFRILDAGRDMLQESHFDLITSRFGIMFFEDTASALTNLHRALKPDGRLVAMVWQELEKNPWMAEPARAVAEIMPKQEPPGTPDPDAPGPFSMGESERVKQLFGLAGYSNLQLRDITLQLDMGAPHEALEFLLEMGPAAALLRDATAAQTAAAREQVSAVLLDFCTGDRITAPAAVRIIRANST